MNSDLDELEKKIEQARHIHDPEKAKSKGKDVDENSRAGLQAGVEFVGAIAVSIAIGYGLDQWLGTKPAFFLVMFFLGICTGFYNVYRVTQNLGTSVGLSQLHKQEKDAKTAPELNNNAENGE